MFWWLCADFSNLAGLFGFAKTVKNDENGGERQQRWTKWEDEKRRKAEMEAQFGTIFTYGNENSGANFYNFGSQKYGAFGDTDAVPFAASAADDRQNWPLSDRLLHTLCTGFGAAFLLLTLPFSLPFSLKFIGPSERLVIMRLGRTKGVSQNRKVLFPLSPIFIYLFFGVHGPGGTVLVLPWVDKAVKVDLSVSSIELPPIQSLTADQGMVELTVTVLSQVTDPLAAYCSIQDVKETLHSLAYATLCRRLSKLLLSDLTSADTMERVLLVKCQDELNAFVRPRGVCVERVALTRLNVLRKADSSTSAMSVLRTLARSQFGQQLFDQLGTSFLAPQPHNNHCTTPTATTPLTPELIIANDDDGKMNGSQIDAAFQRHQQQRTESSTSSTSVTAPLSPISEAASSLTDQSADTVEQPQQRRLDDADLVALLERIGAALCPSLVHRVGRLFRIRCSGTCAAATSTAMPFAEFDIDLRVGNGWCGWTWQRTGPLPPCDVLFTLHKGTLFALLDGTVSPLCAYLEGRVQIEGPVADAALLKHLAQAIGGVSAATQPPQAAEEGMMGMEHAQEGGRGGQILDI
ncbi:hypothetical protein niasHS_009989 [Heterodera schachtii]|uniref:Band 7 domain-containing protein n=1 Tax=Heterodera schachtii TaxID=97005 RepID=A0ABD2JDJ0_HETSC